VFGEAASPLPRNRPYMPDDRDERGVETRFVDTLDYAEAIDEDTAFVHCETVGIVSSVTDGACPVTGLYYRVSAGGVFYGR